MTLHSCVRSHPERCSPHAPHSLRRLEALSRAALAPGDGLLPAAGQMRATAREPGHPARHAQGISGLKAAFVPGASCRKSHFAAPEPKKGRPLRSVGTTSQPVGGPRPERHAQCHCPAAGGWPRGRSTGHAGRDGRQQPPLKAQQDLESSAALFLTLRAPDNARAAWTASALLCAEGGVESGSVCASLVTQSQTSLYIPKDGALTTTTTTTPPSAQPGKTLIPS